MREKEKRGEDLVERDGKGRRGREEERRGDQEWEDEGCSPCLVFPPAAVGGAGRGARGVVAAGSWCDGDDGINHLKQGGGGGRWDAGEEEK